MERTKLRQARIDKGLREKRKLTQLDVAVEIGCSLDIYGMWERGASNPQDRWVSELCKYYGVADPHELDLMPADRILSLEEIIKMLGQYDPHELLAQLQALPLFENIDLLALVESPLATDSDLDRKVVVNIILCITNTENAGHVSMSD